MFTQDNLSRYCSDTGPSQLGLLGMEGGFPGQSHEAMSVSSV